MADTHHAEDDQALQGEKNLEQLFLEGWRSYEELETSTLPFNSSEFQEKVQQSMDKFETTTRLVNQIGLFSPNELIDEVSTDSLQYMLLPLFLGKLALKLNREDRQEVLNIAEVYFKDYLQRCQEYELCEERKSGAGELAKADGPPSNEMAELMRAAQARNNKIAQFKEKKELEEHIKKLREAVINKRVDDEIRRDFFLKFLKKGIIDANEELDSLQLEKQMVQMRKMHMQQAISEERQLGGSDHSHPHGHEHAHGHRPKAPPKQKPLQPFIITRNVAQKAVFGAGYPSLPVMTVDEFYEQRVQEGIFPDEEKVARMNREQALAAAQDPNEKEDMEKAQVQEQEENDDPEYLARMRRMDEYKDVVRRGDGNRYNRS